MRRSLSHLGSAWLLLLVFALSSGAAWKVGGRLACACGMTVGCCCERRLQAGGEGHALKPGASCALRKAGRGCSLRRGEGPAVRSRVDPPSARAAAWLAPVDLAPPDPPGDLLSLLPRSATSAPAREPLSPPPRLA